MRGGTAHCHVRLSERVIGSPLVSRPTVLIGMNGPSLARFLPEVEPNGLALYNASLVAEPATREDVEALAVPASDIAHRIGSTLLANMVMLGAYLEWTDAISSAAAQAALVSLVKRRELLDGDLAALRAGIEWVKTTGVQLVHTCGPDGVP
jgi:Pyruvate/2-oxoacid:ferredoxin oxidoreductase gamma subunit